MQIAWAIPRCIFLERFPFHSMVRKESPRITISVALFPDERVSTKETNLDQLQSIQLGVGESNILALMTKNRWKGERARHRVNTT